MSEQQQQAPEPESGATGPASATAGPEQQQAWTQGGGRSDTAGPEDRRGSGAADGTSPGDSFGQPPLKRQRSGPAPPPLMLEQPTAGVLVAWPAHGAVPPLADPAALVGTRLSGVVEAVTEGAIYVSISLPHGGEWKGALLCPPGSTALEVAAVRVAAAAAPPLKKPRTAFNYFSDQVRPGAKEAHPGADQKGISKVVGDMWAQLDAPAREPFYAAAKSDRLRYERELAEHKALFPQGQRGRTDLQRFASGEGAGRYRSGQLPSSPPLGPSYVPSAATTVAPAPGPPQTSPWSGSLGNSSASALTTMPPPQASLPLQASCFAPWAGAGGPMSVAVEASSRELSSQGPPGSGVPPRQPSPTGTAGARSVQLVTSLLQQLQQQVLPAPTAPAPAAPSPAISQMLASLMGQQAAGWPPAEAPAPPPPGDAPALSKQATDVLGLLTHMLQQQQQPLPKPSTSPR